jgi:hypothetical protein
MQVRLARKVFRSDPRRKISLAPTHAPLAATKEEEITVALSSWFSQKLVGPSIGR